MEAPHARQELRDEMVAAGWLRLTSVDGVFARAKPYLDAERGLERLIDGISAGLDGVVPLRFPPLFPADWYLKTDYLASFPQLTGSVRTFQGTEREAIALLTAAEAGEDWTGRLGPSGLMMVSAACHPAYALFSGRLDGPSVLLDVEGWCFRHEPSVDPTRAQSFRQREFVLIGSRDAARSHRDHWIDRGLEVLASLSIPAQPEVANDPFFGRGGTMLASNQREENLKTELTSALFGPSLPPTALVSCNCHLDHFGLNFGITTPDGEPAHSACVGFGIERIVVALFRHHGPDLDRWPVSVRRALAG